MRIMERNHIAGEKLHTRELKLSLNTGKTGLFALEGRKEMGCFYF